MAVNDYSQMTAALVSELAVALPVLGYTNPLVERRLFRPPAIPPFERYAVIVSPHPRPWEEDRHANLALQYWMTCDLYLLVKDYDDTENPLFGATPPDLGIFQFIHDVKEALRVTDLGGLIQKTYDEPAGDSRRGLGAGGVDFQELASPIGDAAEHAFVHRAKLPYKARMRSFCHAR